MYSKALRMTNIPYRLFFLLALVVGAMLVFQSPALADQITWMGYEEGLATGRAMKKKVFINFYADWCTWCKKLDKETFRDRAVVDYLNRHFVAIKVDTDRRQDLAAAYGIQGLPTLWFVTGQEEKISALASFVPADTFLDVLRYIHSESYNKMKFSDFTKADGPGKN